MLYIAEKPELARAIVEALGGGEKRREYYECGADRVTWCFGHMLELCQPEDYDLAFKKWTLTDLPLFFVPWRKRTLAKSKEQFAVIAATVSQIFNDVPVVATMDAANLPVVAAAFKEKYPDKEQVIFADRTLGKENDQDHAKQAAEKTGAGIATPRFASNEKTSDFSTSNDLAAKSELGKDAVREQCESAVETAEVARLVNTK